MNVYLFLTVIAFVINLQAVVVFLFTMPRSKVNWAFIASTFSFAWFAFFLLILQGQDEIHRLYLFDRIAVFGWATFPVFLTILFYFLAQESRRIFKIPIFYFLLPVSLAVIFRYLYDPQSIKTFYRTGEIWYFSINHSSPWPYIFPIYLLLCGAISFFLVYSWLLAGKTNKEKLQARVVFFSLVVFFFLSLLTNIVFPFGSRQDLPPMAHFNFIPLIVGLFFSLTSLRFKPFNQETISRLVARDLQAFVIYLDQRGLVIGANQYALQRLGYSQTGISVLPGNGIIRNLEDFQERLAPGKVCGEEHKADLVTSTGDILAVKGTLIAAGSQLRGQTGMLFIGSDHSTEHKAREQLETVQLELSRLSGLAGQLELLVKQRKQELSNVREQLSVGRHQSRRAFNLSSRELKEKEQLVQEIHHRVKNNMQMVISLVNMLRTQPGIPHSAAEKFGGIADRVRYISAIHEDFYSTPFLSKINFGQFLHKATGELNAQVRPSRKILFNLNVSNEYLPVDLALPCGLVFHELLQNALRHAFPEKEGDAVQPSAAMVGIEFFRRDASCTLVVSDNGIGIPESGMARHASGAMGLHLVNALVRDHLKGKIEIKRSFGTTARLQFNWQE
jgi:two-component sensor histidine kinase